MVGHAAECASRSSESFLVYENCFFVPPPEVTGKPANPSAQPWCLTSAMEKLQVRSLWIAHLMSWTAMIMVLVWALAYQVGSPVLLGVPKENAACQHGIHRNRSS